MKIPEALIAKYARNGPRYTSYPTAAAFRSDFPADRWPAMLRDETSRGPTAFYVHLPFCRSLCYFCACHKVISSTQEPVARYLLALIAEMQRYSAALGGHVTVDHLHLGGGTPNFLSAAELHQLLAGFQEAFPDRSDDAELSIELDPRTMNAEHLVALRELRFTRISCGVQDFDPAVQEAINRLQTYEQMQELIGSARRAGVRSVNIDLIYGLPRQTVDGFARTLARVVELRPERIALYGYAHLPSREKVQNSFRRWPLPTPAERIMLFSTAIEQLTAAGYEHLGMDHFALPADPLARALKNGSLRRNFMGYTDRVSQPLVGLGVSAVSSTMSAFAQNEKDIAAYEEQQLERRMFSVQRGLVRSPDDAIRGDLIERLLCERRVDINKLSQRWSIDFDHYFSDSFGSLLELEADELVVRSGDILEVTSLGGFFLRNIAMAFDSFLPAQQAAGAVFSQTI